MTTIMMMMMMLMAVKQKRLTRVAVGPERSLKDRLSEVGILPDHVTDVIFSHAHW